MYFPNKAYHKGVIGGSKKECLEILKRIILAYTVKQSKF